MKAYVILAGLTFATTAVADDSAAKFTQYCRSKDNHEVAYCIGYVTGMLHMQQLAYRDKVFCPPHNITVGQLMKVAMKYCDDHPEELHEAFLYVAARSFSIAFPCK